MWLIGMLAAARGNDRDVVVYVKRLVSPEEVAAEDGDGLAGA